MDKIDLKISYTKRKLKNISIEDFTDSVKNELNSLFSESQLKIINQAHDLIAKHLCFNYKYTKDDYMLINEALKTLNNKLSLVVRKNIEQFEIAHNIKTIWGGDTHFNIKGQNFKLTLNE